MAQFDVFVNSRRRRAPSLSFVVACAIDFAQNERDQIVAPLVPVGSMPTVSSRLTPIVALNGSEHMVLVPALTGMRFRDLMQRHASLASARSQLLGAVDYLFFGV